MGLKCERYCINQIESVCYKCDHSMIRGRILEVPDNSHAFHQGVDSNGNAGVFEDFEQSIGE